MEEKKLIKIFDIISLCAIVTCIPFFYTDSIYDSYYESWSSLLWYDTTLAAITIAVAIIGIILLALKLNNISKPFVSEIACILFAYFTLFLEMITTDGSYASFEGPFLYFQCILCNGLVVLSIIKIVKEVKRIKEANKDNEN